MKRAFVLAWILAILAVQFAGSRNAGFSNECVDDQCVVGASSSALGLAASLGLIAFVALYRQQAVKTAYSQPVKISERLAAFLIDFFVAVCAVGAIFTLPILFVEAQTTGRFQWHFQRNFGRPLDPLVELLPIFAMQICVIGYFYGHAKLGRATVGQYLMELRLESSAGDATKPPVGANTFLALIGLCMWPISLILAVRRGDKAFWWNLATRTRVVHVHPAVA
jgi:hypothetical protein